MRGATSEMDGWMDGWMIDWWMNKGHGNWPLFVGFVRWRSQFEHSKSEVPNSLSRCVAHWLDEIELNRVSPYHQSTSAMTSIFELWGPPPTFHLPPMFHHTAGKQATDNLFIRQRQHNDNSNNESIGLAGSNCCSFRRHRCVGANSILQEMARAIYVQTYPLAPPFVLISFQYTYIISTLQW